MTTDEVAAAFVKACAAGDYPAAERLWSDEVVSIEAMPGNFQRLEGRAAVLEKHKWWNENMTVHSATCEGPFVNGDQFGAIFALDCTGPDGRRMAMREVALYTVRDGAVVEERFFPQTASAT